MQITISKFWEKWDISYLSSDENLEKINLSTCIIQIHVQSQETGFLSYWSKNNILTVLICEFKNRLAY